MKMKKLPLIGAMIVALSAVADGAAAANPQVSIKTSMGEIVVELYPDKAPKSVENFLQYVRDDHYKGTIFHRVIGNFMIQGGGFSADFYKPGTPNYGQKPTRAPIPIESKNGLRNDAGWIAMARTSDPNSATAQFFINTVDNASLSAPLGERPNFVVTKDGQPVAPEQLPLQRAARDGVEVKNVALDVVRADGAV